MKPISCMVRSGGGDGEVSDPCAVAAEETSGTVCSAGRRAVAAGAGPGYGLVFFAVGLWLFLCLAADVPATWAADFMPFLAADPDTVPAASKAAKPRVWLNEVGGGWRSGTRTFGISAGVTSGVLIFGGEDRHHLALTSLSYGIMVGGVKGVGTWYQGNWELRGELFGGAQFNSETCWLAGVAPHLRYHFTFGSRFVPYIDAGGGLSLTEIRAPDLGGTFQFNLQGAVGANYFLRDDLAVSMECRYIHLSSASLTRPNNGVNTIGAFLGMNVFF